MKKSLFKFLLDTGASLNIFPLNLAQQLNFPIQKLNEPIIMKTITNKQPIDLYTRLNTKIAITENFMSLPTAMNQHKVQDKTKTNTLVIQHLSPAPKTDDITNIRIKQDVDIITEN
ncbi:hypothetical protein SSS_01968 [Sarcoptes scabiei]|uniref:Uncharacterized protein n=1 Tax=Sarcoptes scabiei TaxID=52283 RepID=A0A834R403_SARSC|nr:hypothetical protein SSS_01968 [Sarcoptes scabiei]